MSDLALTVACGPYDHTAALRSGEIRPEGIDLRYLRLRPHELFWRALSHREFDVCEMSLSAYTLRVSRGEDDLVGLPIFPLRSFRQSCIYVGPQSEVQGPEDLRGRRVGVPEYHQTAVLFIRGFLLDDYNIRADEIEWVQAGLQDPGREERVDLKLPSEIHLTLERGKSLEEMLLAGQIDAIFSPATPRAFLTPSTGVRRLFQQAQEVECDYYARTGIYPIMHLLAVKRELYEQHKWIAPELVKAFTEAKDKCLATLREGATDDSAVPFLKYQLERIRVLIGEDFLPYGVDENRVTLEAAVRYSYLQGLSACEVSVEELFAPNTLKRSLT